MSEPLNGAVVVQAISQLFRVPQAYELDNQFVASAISNVLHLLPNTQGQGLTVADIVGAFYVNTALVRLGSGSNEPAVQLRRIWQRLKVQELSMSAATTEADLRAFLATYQRHWRSPTPPAIKDEPFERIRLRAVGSITLDPSAARAATIDQRQNVLRAYARLAVLMDEVVQRSRRREPYRTPLLRKAVQQLHDASAGHESLLAGLTRFQSFRGELHFHLTAVGALVLLMGRRLKLGKVTLIELVLAALLHDLGRQVLEASEAPPELSAREALAFRVPALSLLALADGFTAEAMSQAATAFEQSVPVWHSGVWAPGASAKLIAVASFYDLLTTERPPRRGLAPDQAMRVVFQQAGTRLDPVAVRLLASSIGLYPVGTVVLLSSGERALILEVPADAALFSKPVVKVIAGTHGATEALVDLANDPAGRTIERTLDAGEAEVNPAALLLA